MMKKVFISRKQTPESIFFKILSEKGFEVIGRSLIEISPVPFSNFPKTDWIFFYSKNGVKYFFSQLHAPLPKDTKLATIGPGTAAYLEKEFEKAVFIGNGDPALTSQAFLKLATAQSILFPRAKNSRRSVQKLIVENATCVDLVVYNNKPLTDLILPSFDCLVFTSPMNVDAYFTKNKFKEHQKIIAIGEPTADSLKGKGISNLKIAESTDEESLSKAVLESF